MVSDPQRHCSSWVARKQRICNKARNFKNGTNLEISPSLNCSKKHWSRDQKRRMSGIPNRSMATRSRPAPKAHPILSGMPGKRETSYEGGEGEGDGWKTGTLWQALLNNTLPTIPTNSPANILRALKGSWTGNTPPPTSPSMVPRSPPPHLHYRPQPAALA